MRVTLAAWLIAGVFGCGKTPAVGAADAGGGIASARVAQQAPASSSSSASASPQTWRGTYKSAAGSVYVPPDWKNVRWKGADTTAGIGDGDITLSVDASNGRVQGALGGPLGPAKVEGLALDGMLTAKIARDDPNDQGFAGTLVGTMSSGKAEGTINASAGVASAVRNAAFDLTLESPGK